MRTNLTGPFLMAKHAAAAMGEGRGRQRRRPHRQHRLHRAKRAWPNAAAYHATQWGLLGLSHALHAELRPLASRCRPSSPAACARRSCSTASPTSTLDVLQDPLSWRKAVKFVLTQPDETVIPELMVLPMRETSWP